MNAAKLSRYWKAVIAAAGPVFLVVQAAVTDNRISTEEWVGIGAAVAVAAGVFMKRNAPAVQTPAPPAERRMA